LKLIVDRLDVLIKSKEISKSDIQSELNRIIVEIQELSKMTTNEKYLEVANQYKQLIADKLKLLESKIHQQ
jgi:dimeric dUTPase (all-alpha-NTP-PPase superfamily)